MGHIHIVWESKNAASDYVSIDVFYFDITKADVLSYTNILALRQNVYNAVYVCIIIYFL